MTKLQYTSSAHWDVTDALTREISRQASLMYMVRLWQIDNALFVGGFAI